MKHTLMLMGAAALAFAAAPAAAKPDKGHGNHGKHGAHAAMNHGKSGKAKMYGYGGSCPPGLAKHENHCMPHGQFKKLYGVGQAYPGNYGSLWNYNRRPCCRIRPVKVKGDWSPAIVPYIRNNDSC